ncbi:putative Glycosaminoglycan polysaccharide lyase [Giardia muris]|uniref:Putative Glycosaminoglycan polysaccharide lyase n=1 Tax=Giardia muris TaxID=5742 RepID=A0A4Z1T1L1_GIAMU|nr:putative Glycosaminoglycan polysaccharide lyase [Giardia muris]|eukprot:TNJ29588.1 putative Glycosaminoglycan polysaccharide lyase [Giardia muris]
MALIKMIIQLWIGLLLGEMARTGPVRQSGFMATNVLLAGCTFKTYQEMVGAPQELLNRYYHATSTSGKAYYDSYSKSYWNDLSLTTPLGMADFIQRMYMVVLSYQYDPTSMPDAPHLFTTMIERINGNLPYLFQPSNMQTYPNSFLQVLSDIPCIIGMIDSVTPFTQSFYSSAINSMAGTLNTRVNSAEYLNQCIDQKAYWTDVNYCMKSSLTMNAYRARMYIGIQALWNDFRSITQVLQPLADMYQPIYRNFSVDNPDTNYDGFRPDGSLQFYYNTNLAATEAYDLVAELTLLCEMGREAVAILRADYPMEVIIITNILTKISNTLDLFVQRTIFPALIECGIPDSYAGSTGVKFGAQAPTRMLNWFVGIGRVIKCVEGLGMATSGDSKMRDYIGVLMHLNTSCNAAANLVNNLTFGVVAYLQNKTREYSQYTPRTYHGPAYSPFHDQFIYMMSQYTVLLSMHSFRTRNYQCVRNLNCQGYYQNTGALSIYISGYKNQYANYSAAAFRENLTKPAIIQAYAPTGCTDQEANFATRSSSTFVTSVHKKNDAFTSYEYYNLTTGGLATRTLYLFNGDINAIHTVSFMSYNGTNDVTATQTLLSIPLALETDSVTITVDGVTSSPSTGSNMISVTCQGARRVIFTVTGQISFSMAVVFSEYFTGVARVGEKQSSFSSNGDAVTGPDNALKKRFIEIVANRATQLQRTDGRKVALELVYTIFPRLAANLNDDSLKSLLSDDQLSHYFGDYMPSTFAPEEMNYTLIRWTNESQTIIGFNCYGTTPVPFLGPIMVTCPGPLSLLIKVVGTQGNIVVRDPTALTADQVSLTFANIPADVNIWKEGRSGSSPKRSRGGTITIPLNIAQGVIDTLNLQIPLKYLLMTPLPAIPTDLATTILSAEREYDEIDERPVQSNFGDGLLKGLIATVVIALLLFVAGLAVSVFFLIKTKQFRKRSSNTPYLEPCIIANNSFTTLSPSQY